MGARKNRRPEPGLAFGSAEMPFLNSWAAGNPASGLSPPELFLDLDGRIQVEGVIDGSGAVTDTPIVTLPARYAIGAQQRFTQVSDDGATFAQTRQAISSDDFELGGSITGDAIHADGFRCKRTQR